jgi:DnaJ like chaperone protein
VDGCALESERARFHFPRFKTAVKHANSRPMPWSQLSDILGMAKGGAVRGALETIWTAIGGSSDAEGRSGIAFTIAVVSLCAKMAKADGVVVPSETEMFERHFHVPADEIANIRRLYDLAKQDVAGFEAYAERIARLLSDEPALLSDVLETLFHIATADGIVHVAEEAFLKVVAEKFGITGREYRRLRALFVRDPESPYEVLGATPADSDATIKARYRQLVLEHHPDRLIAHGVPEAFAGIAESKLATINAAWDAIRKERHI